MPGTEVLNCPPKTARLRRWINQEVDLANVTFMDSSALGTLVTARWHLDDNDA